MQRDWQTPRIVSRLSSDGPAAGSAFPLAVETVAGHGHAAHGRLQPQLVHPAGDRPEFDEHAAGVQSGEQPGLRDSLTGRSVRRHRHPGPRLIRDLFKKIPPLHACRSRLLQGGHRGGTSFPRNHRHIRLGNLPPLELPRELPRCPRRGRHQEHSRHGAIEPVRHSQVDVRSRAGCRRQPVSKPRFDRRDSRRRLRGQSRGLLQGDHARSLEQYPGLDGCQIVGVKSLYHGVTALGYGNADRFQGLESRARTLGFAVADRTSWLSKFSSSMTMK